MTLDVKASLSSYERVFIDVENAAFKMCPPTMMSNSSGVILSIARLCGIYDGERRRGQVGCRMAGGGTRSHPNLLPNARDPSHTLDTGPSRSVAPCDRAGRSLPRLDCPFLSSLVPNQVYSPCPPPFYPASDAEIHLSSSQNPPGNYRLMSVTVIPRRSASLPMRKMQRHPSCRSIRTSRRRLPPGSCANRGAICGKLGF